MTKFVDSQNRYAQYAQENVDRIAHLKGRIERFKQRGVRLDSIPAIEQEIAALERQLPNLCGTAKLVDQKYGEFAA